MFVLGWQMQDWNLSYTLQGHFPSDYDEKALSTSPLHVYLDGLNESAILGARLLLQSMPNNPNVKNTFIPGANASRLLVSMHSWCSSGGKMGRHLSRGACIQGSVNLSKHNRKTTWFRHIQYQLFV